MKRNQKTVVVLALLFLLPLFSYIYLKKGFDFQVNNLEEIAAKGSIAKDIPSEILYLDSAMNKVNMILLWDQNFSEQSYENLSKINKQYAEVDNWSGYVYTQVWNRNKNELDKLNIVKLNSDQWEKLPSYFIGDSLNINSGTAILLDIDNRIRRTYDFGDQEQIKKMIAHSALLFPVEE